MTTFTSLSITECPGLKVALREGQPVLLGTRPRCSLYLGAICDPAGQVQQLVEIWVQDFSRSAHSLLEPMTNAQSDLCWQKLIAGLVRNPAVKAWRGPWEAGHGVALVLGDEEEVWQLCRDEELLREKGLESYSQTECRYLHRTGDDRFLALQASEGVQLASEVFSHKVVFNRQGGSLFVRELVDFGFDQFVAYLGGEDGGSLQRAAAMPLDVSPVGGLPDGEGDGFLFQKVNPDDRIAEVFFLKLCALRGAFGAVRDAVAELKLPFGGLAADSFGVRVHPTVTGLPFLWTQAVVLRDAPCYAALPLGEGGGSFPVAVVDEKRTLYAPTEVFQAREGQGRMQLDSLLGAPEAGQFVLNGRLATAEPLESGRKDLLRIELTEEGGARFSFFATVDGKDGGEWTFKSYPTVLPAGVSEADVGGSGLRFDQVSFRLFPKIDSGRDLYSLAVLSVRTLFSEGGAGLGETLGDFQTLVGEFRNAVMKEEWETGAGGLLNFVKSGEGKWLECFGAVRLVRGGDAEMAKAAVPEHLWWAVLEWLVGLFSEEAAWGGVSEVVFDGHLERLEELVDQARLLMVGDTSVNRDLARVVGEMRE